MIALSCRLFRLLDQCCKGVAQSCQTEILVLIAVAPIKVMYVLTKSYGEKEIGVAEVVSLVLLFCFVFGFGII